MAGVEEWERTHEISGVSLVKREVGTVAFQESLCENTLYSHGAKPLPKGKVEQQLLIRIEQLKRAQNFRSRSKLRAVSSTQEHYTKLSGY